MFPLFATGDVDTSGKFATGVDDTGGKFAAGIAVANWPVVSTTLAKLVEKFAAGVIDTVGKFAAGVVGWYRWQFYRRCH